MILCSICAARVQQSFSHKELREVPDAPQKNNTCGHCRKIRYCSEYEMVDKEESK